jgi:hypothetical protein
MWTYLGPSCPDRPSSEELSAVEVEARIHKVLDLGVNPIPGAILVPLQRGITSVRVYTLGLVSVSFVILSFHCTHDLAQGLGGGRDEPRDADQPADATGWEARHASSEETLMWEERERSTHRRTGSETVRDRGLF